MTCSFGPKSRDYPPKFFQRLQGIGQMSRRLIRTHPKSDHFQSAPAQKGGIKTFSQDRHLALGSERKSTGLNRAQKFTF